MPKPPAPATVNASSASAFSTGERGLSITADKGCRMRSASSAIRLIHTPFDLSVGLYAVFDPEAIHARADLISPMHLRVPRGQGVQKRAVARPEVADADRAVGVGEDFEVAAGEELVGHAHVAFAADNQPRDRDLELLACQRPLDADEDRASVIGVS